MPTDEQAAHQHFSKKWFNETWTYFDKAIRTPAEEEQMLELAVASLAHWRSRADGAPLNLSIGCWQVSRAFALAGEASLARRYGLLCQEYSRSLEPFYQGYASEALARAELAAGNLQQAQSHLAEAYTFCARVPDPEERQALEDDLDMLASQVHENQ